MSEAILNRINKLNKMAESAKDIGNEAEAAAFAQKVQSLLMEHKLDMTEVDGLDDDNLNFQIDEELFTWDIGTSNKRSHWLQRLAVYVTNYNGCRLCVMSGTNSVYIIGTQESRAVVCYLLNVLSRFGKESLEKEYRKAYYQAKKQGKTYLMKNWRRSFANGYVNTIGLRLKEEHDRFMSEHVSERGLVVLDQEKLALEDYMSQYGHTKLKFTQNQHNEHGLLKGSLAGESVNLQVNVLTEDGNRVVGIGHES